MNKKVKVKQTHTGINNRRPELFLILTIIAVIIVFGKSLPYDILNFDDNEYFGSYPEILNLSWVSLKKYFTSYYVLMYQPLPVLSFALTYKFFGLDPIAHHLVNLGFHIINIYFVGLLAGKLWDKPYIKHTVTFLFALHPLAVEAVVWISCRSSVMYTCFYLLGLLSFIKYRETGLAKNLILCYTWFILSLLCKAHAVTFPFAVILMDLFYFKRTLNKSLIYNTIGLFTLSITFGIIALLNSETLENITKANPSYSIIHYFFLVSYELAWYLVKIILPYNLSPIVVYPPLINGYLPVLYYLSPLLLVAMGYLVIKFAKTIHSILFGVLFFYLLISVTLQIVPSRLFIVADRYGYLPNIGVFFIISYLLNQWEEKRINFLRNFEGKQTIFYILVAGILLLSFNQVSVWENDLTLSDRIIEINPETDYIAKAYGVRANYKKDKIKDFAGALQDYEKAGTLDPTDWISRYQSGLIYKSMGDTALAFAYLKRAHNANPKSPVPYTDIGVIYSENKNYILADRYADSALMILNFFPNALNLKGVCALNSGNPLLAEKHFTKAISVRPDYIEAIKNRAIIRTYDLNNKKGACEDYNRAAMLGDADCQRMVREYCGSL